MNPILKKALSVVAFIVIALIIPTIVLLIFFDASSQFSVYAFVYALIIFGVFGYVVVSVKQMQNELSDALEEIKKQNAAIAHKLSGGQPVDLVADVENAVNYAKVTLNPEEPLVISKPAKTEVKPEAKPTDDGFDDFK
ncbi:MAG: hypothetical protein E7529_06395 [Ruminococcaceae bacterium]|nr:hypothetical protein [Oscillospiraceae bacterium]